MSVLQNHQVTILVVDPDESTRVQIHQAIIADGYSCLAVASAEAAKEAVAESSPNLLICDVNLGEDSGLELFASLRNSIDCPVVFISDSRRQETVQHALRAGATYFLSKPFDPSVLLELVDKALWMPHLVRRHIDSAAHQLKAPTFAPAATRSPMSTK